MNFLPDPMVQNLALRAELTLGLLRLARYEDAVNGALPLIGTKYQAWFIHARAWQEWDQGQPETARGLLKEALDLLGQSGTRPLDFVLIDGRPLMSVEFSCFSAPCSLRDKALPEKATFPEKLIDSPAQVEKFFVFLYPQLPLCVTGLWSEPALWSENDLDFWGDLVTHSLSDRQFQRDMADQLWKLWVRYTFRVAVAASTAFYFILLGRYRAALKVCRTFLLQRPYISMIRALEIVCLYRLGRRQEALSQGEYLLAQGRRDYEGLGLLVLGQLALEEGEFEVASRFLQESATRGNVCAAELERTIPWFEPY